MHASVPAMTPAAPAGTWRWLLALTLMVASGFAALGYQIVWTQQSAVWLGHETTAVLAVVAAFFGGIGVGALVLGPHIDRSARPARWYAACEAVIGLWSLVLAMLIAPASAWLLQVIGPQPGALRQWTVAFGGTMLLLLPATAAMGATLPAMERVMGQLRHQVPALAALYAGNTFGAVLGVLAAAFWLVPAIGLLATAFVCAILNLLCAAAVLVLPLQGARVSVAPRTTTPPRVLPLLVATGLLGIGFEVLVVRVLSQVSENTVYTFAMMLAVYLVGTATGAAGYQRWLAAAPPAQAATLRDRLLAWLAFACLLGTLSLWAAELLRNATQRLLGPGMAAALTAEAVLAVVAFLPATLVMGAVFSHLCSIARSGGIDFGRALGVNTLGAAAAPALFGVWLLPAIGPKLALLLVATGYLALLSLHAWRSPLTWTTAVVALAAASLAPPLKFVDVPAGGRVLSYRDGAMAAVSVVEDAAGVATLRINNRQQEGSSATLYADARQALLPLLLHPHPRHALFLGLGTGVTASAAARQPGLRVDAVELLPEVIEASSHFIGPLADGGGDARPVILAADARRFVRAADIRYDVIVSDNFHPARSGSAALYTVEHFDAVRRRLADGGVFCQWLPLHQLDLATLRSIVRSFLAVYPHAWAMLATNSLETPVIGLVARNDAARFDGAALLTRLAAAAWPGGPLEFGLVDQLSVLGSFIAGPGALARFAAGAPVNTDDRPVVAYLAPRITYAPDSLPRDRLLELLSAVSIEPAELVDTSIDPAGRTRLAGYWRARDRYLEVGRGIVPSSDPADMLRQVRGPLLDVLKLSPDFRPAYDPLLQMALALASADPDAARALLGELAQLQPARAEAAIALARLDGGAR